MADTYGVSDAAGRIEGASCCIRRGPAEGGMSGAIQVTIAADSSADLLCRLIGLFAQRDLAAPGMTVDITGREMIVTIDLTDLDGRTASLLAEKMARCIGVEAVTIDSTPIAHLAPAQRVPVG